MQEQQTVRKKSQPANSKKHKTAAKKPRRKNSNASGIMAFLVLFLAAYLILSLLTAAFIWYSFSGGAENDDIYSVRIYHDENLLYKISTTDANNEYGLYIPFEYLAEISSFGLAGNGDDMTLFIIGTDNRIKCTKNSSLVVINDNAVRISSPILYENGEYYIPVTLIENYINGIDVNYNDEDMICDISIGVSKSNIELNLLLPDPMENAYFPESYKYYDYDNSTETPNTP